MPHARDDFNLLAELPDAAIDLPRAALAVSALFQPGLDAPGALRRLSDLGDAALADIPRGQGLTERVRALNRFLFEQEGFDGNLADFYDPRNSFLDQVLERRTGIPISLSLVYVEVARRLGIPAFGVGFPGHYLVRVGAGDTLLVLDPFSRGASLDLDDLDRRLGEVYGSGALRVAANPSFLRPATRRETLVRMLANLKVIFLRGGDLEQALIAVDALLRLRPDTADDLRDRGLIYRELGYDPAAAADLRRYLAVSDDPAEVAGLTPVLAELEATGMRVH